MNAPETLATAWLPADPDGSTIRAAFLADERMTVAALAAHAAVDDDSRAQISRQARAS